MSKQIKYRNTHVVRQHKPNRPQRYPNAAQSGYYFTRLIDGALTAVTSFGALFILFFLITL